ncbi:hypothetical protein EQG49_06570 [Periweissella cryptocerci]|uniref:Uncharacterized protein n=2 Tax=Periweissella cryptocerci TaxID=2506420 RepID=A0A4V1AIN7_9LACO|nr:hypothetical protein EQG49_06570 [Periweissella cryptocerci]
MDKLNDLIKWNPVYEINTNSQLTRVDAIIGHTHYPELKKITGDLPNRKMSTIEFERSEVKIQYDEKKTRTIFSEDIKAIHVGIIRQHYLNGRKMYRTMITLRTYTQSYYFLVHSMILSFTLANFNSQYEIIDDLKLIEKFNVSTDLRHLMKQIDEYSYQNLVKSTIYAKYI